MWELLLSSFNKWRSGPMKKKSNFSKTAARRDGVKCSTWVFLIQVLYALYAWLTGISRVIWQEGRQSKIESGYIEGVHLKQQSKHRSREIWSQDRQLKESEQKELHIRGSCILLSNTNPCDPTCWLGLRFIQLLCSPYSCSKFPLPGIDQKATLSQFHH